MKRSRGLKNVSRLRQKLRRFPNDVTDEIKDEVRGFAADVEASMKFRAASSSRRVVDSISKAIGADGMSAKIGIRGKRARARAWFAHFIEFGTAPHSLGSRGGAHPGTAARPFMEPSFEENRVHYQPRIRRAIDAAIAKVSRGV